MSGAPAAAEDRGWMERALDLARRGRGTTSPNPMVGAVVVRDGVCVGEGFHVRAGGPHAEVHALREAGADARGADMYVTLEPCNHRGRTGPCTEAILRAGVARVILGAGDPNPQVCGSGVARLREGGVEVITGVLAEECHALNEIFEHWITTGRPLVVLKLAATLDGRIAARTGASRWITGPEARREVHRMRARLDAVMVGSGTALADDPRLTARGVDDEAGGDPLRIVVDSGLAVPTTARLFEGAGAPGVLVATARPDDDPGAEVRRSLGAEVWSLPSPDGRVDVTALIDRLGARIPRPVTSVLVEGGSGLATALLRAGRVDRLITFLAPRLMGSDGVPAVGSLGVDTPDEAPGFVVDRVRRVGADVEIVARPGQDGSPRG
ncbi:MAG: bifunctional diaminohydroxyphosphoribosylaminopyrimidine deaminase/5-amino-6-(5-phosphoribosylamino)uracil reductase RibD [Myxococcota bacterium]